MQTSTMPKTGITGSRRLRRGIAASGLAMSAAILAGCGFNVQTDKVYQPGIGANQRTGQVDVLSAVVVSNQKGQGVFLSTLVNKNPNTADSLTGIAAEDAQVATVTGPIPAGGILNLADRKAPGVPVTGSKIEAGGYLTVQVSFGKADPVSIDVPIVPTTPPYQSILPSPSSSATPSTSAEESPAADAEAGH